MDKQEFLNTYIYAPSKIRMRFDVEAFISDETIQVVKEKLGLQDLLSYYVPKYEKQGERDMRDIKQQLKDSDTHPLLLNKAILDPVKWDLNISTKSLPPIEKIQPVPIATDLISQKSLLLDSNHTITAILSRLKPDLSTKIDIVRIIGTSLEDVIGDFGILNRV